MERECVGQAHGVLIEIRCASTYWGDFHRFGWAARWALDELIEKGRKSWLYRAMHVDSRLRGKLCEGGR